VDWGSRESAVGLSSGRSGSFARRLHTEDSAIVTHNTHFFLPKSMFLILNSRLVSPVRVHPVAHTHPSAGRNRIGDMFVRFTMAGLYTLENLRADLTLPAARRRSRTLYARRVRRTAEDSRIGISVPPIGRNFRHERKRRCAYRTPKFTIQGRASSQYEGTSEVDRKAKRTTANLAWVQHFIHLLESRGMADFRCYSNCN